MALAGTLKQLWGSPKERKCLAHGDPVSDLIQAF